jgi:hypothetical protein
VLQVGLDGFVLFVELGQVGDDVFYDVGVWQRVDFRFLLRVGGDTTYQFIISFILSLPKNSSIAT